MNNLKINVRLKLNKTKELNNKAMKKPNNTIIKFLMLSQNIYILKS